MEVILVEDDVPEAPTGDALAPAEIGSGPVDGDVIEKVMGLFMEVDARDHSLRESVNRQIEEARLDENLFATSNARDNLAAAQENSKSLQIELHAALEALKRADGRTVEALDHAKSLEAELSHTREVLKESDTRTAAAEVRCEEVLRQLSSMVETLRERDEAISQREEVQRQHEALKADFVGVQAHLDKESKLHNQQLSYEIKTLEHKCSALLEEASHAEDRIQMECERRLMEYKESAELKKKIDQACEAYLQAYKDSPELKAS
ncbi:uncharacterized protein LOC110602086 [Manihot esculenta]|uniref:uncharacterized protein LOC110602086 n=1 Tax=Manihot esculenta TaxID=3983 RepID=UPI001CC3BF04|nr:uncharacterized protein LOC110602086 [Manihot esculenta]